VYDMYQWDLAEAGATDPPSRPGTRPARPASPTRTRRLTGPSVPAGSPARGGRGGRGAARASNGRARDTAPAERAVQVALDRRDNGGNTSLARDQ
jgi:hypothetical protein